MRAFYKRTRITVGEAPWYITGKISEIVLLTDEEAASESGVYGVTLTQDY